MIQLYTVYQKKFTVGKYSLDERAGQICKNLQLAYFKLKLLEMSYRKAH